MDSNRIKSGRVPVSRYIYLGLSWGLVACIVIQVFIAGLAVFGEPSHWHSHVLFVHLFEYLPLLMLLFAFIGKLPAAPKWQSFGLFLLVFSQYLTANLPGTGALHPVIAVALFWFSLSVARRAGGYIAKSVETSASR
ncbi:DUF6220 domain-containing protein [Paenibacillus mesophilus]|uniref:DUF6220 domain-containing protein n=1 Tax=Paenibacillus mesophilus TaxID=2582849 RepID=UPI001EE3C784|nr:DUF6220 domain-containing protein [Paenibacillus mesophilus]